MQDPENVENYQEFKRDDPEPEISNLQSSSDDSDSIKAVSLPQARKKYDKL